MKTMRMVIWGEFELFDGFAVVWRVSGRKLAEMTLEEAEDVGEKELERNEDGRLDAYLVLPDYDGKIVWMNK